jgi:hypothetical protein
MHFFLLTGTGSLMEANEKGREGRLAGLPWMSVLAKPLKLFDVPISS